MVISTALAAVLLLFVAGCDVIVYYNRTQSEILRERNRIQLILGFNQWEMQADQVGSCHKLYKNWCAAVRKIP
jgi:hypothetical protein